MKTTMIKIFSSIFCLVICLCLIPSALADGEIVDSGTWGNLEWSLDANGLLIISGEGDMNDFSSNTGYDADAWRKYDYQITAVSITSGVTSIGKYAFYGMNRLQSVEIADSVTHIKSNAILSCSNLEYVQIPSSVATLDYNWMYCPNLTSAGPIGSGCNIEFGWTTEIPYGAFSYCSSLSNVILPEGITTIGRYAFYECNKLSKVIIPSTATVIGKEAFKNCPNLTSAGPLGSECNIEFGWTDEIPPSAFYSCSNLTNITIPEGLSCIGDEAFSHCYDLKSIIIPESITSIGKQAFRFCRNLTSVTIPSNNTTSSNTSIGKSAFEDCARLESVIMLEGITSIGERAFAACSKLTSVTIPSSVTSISGNCFSWGGLTDVFYGGAPSQWQQINIGNNNTDLINATIHYSRYDIWMDVLNGSVAIMVDGKETTTAAPNDIVSLTMVPDVGYELDSLSVKLGETDIPVENLCFTMPSGEVNITTTFKIIKYLVSYYANGGGEEPENQTKIYGISLSLSSIVPIHVDNPLDGFTVTFDTNGGSVIPTSLTADRNTKYTFKQWNTKSDGSGISFAPGATYAANEALTLYAQWDSRVETTAISLPTPTRDKSVFLGWATSNDAAEGITGNYTPDGDVTLYAIWADSEYAVSYDANGGTGTPEEQIKQYGVGLALSTAIPIRAEKTENYTVRLNANGGLVTPRLLSASRITRYSFTNWNTRTDGNGVGYASGDIYTDNANITLYAQWNTMLEPAPVALPTPIWEGHTFKGWATTVNATEGVTGEYMPEANITLYAIWEITKYPVTYDANSGTGAPENQFKIYGENLPLSSATPTREDISEGIQVKLNANGGNVSPHSLFATRFTTFEFKEWNTEQDGSGITYAPGTVYTENNALTLYAQWDSETETTAVSLPPPINGNYTFLGWATSIDETVGITGYYTPEGNVTLFALWDKPTDEPDFILPASTTVVGEDAFSGCAFRYVRLSENTQEIQKSAFSNCRNLKLIYIPEATRSIDKDAFSDDSGIIIIGKSGSYAETYALENGFDFSPQM